METRLALILPNTIPATFIWSGIEIGYCDDPILLKLNISNLCLKKNKNELSQQSQFEKFVILSSDSKDAKVTQFSFRKSMQNQNSVLHAWLFV